MKEKMATPKELTEKEKYELLMKPIPKQSKYGNIENNSPDFSDY
jgi:hypothetical protein